MGWSGSDFQRTHNFSADASAGINILASRVDAEFDNFETGLEACLKIDGSNAPDNDFNMGGFKHTNVGAAASTNQYLRLDQFQQLTPILVSFAGTAEALSVSTSPVFDALVTGHTVIVSVGSANNTVSVNLNLNGIGAQPVRDLKGNPLAVGAMQGLGMFVWNGTYFAKINSNVPGVFSASVNFKAEVAFSGSTSFTSATIYDGAAQVAMGYRDIPRILVDIGRELSLNDRSHLIYHATTSTLDITIPTNASVGYQLTTAILIQNGNAAGVISISAASGVSLIRAGTGSTGVRILSADCDAMLKNVTNNIWYISGNGLT
jgi:hypothetical protein